MINIWLIDGRCCHAALILIDTTRTFDFYCPFGFATIIFICGKHAKAITL